MNTQPTITRKPQESEIKKKIREELEKAGWIVIMLIVSNKDGEPDVIALQNNGRCVFIETKIPGKSPRPLQAFRHAQLRKKGFEVIVATSVDDVKHLIP